MFNYRDKKPPIGAQLRVDHHWSTKGLVGCWVLNESGSFAIRDSSKTSQHGTLIGPNIGWVVGQHGQAIEIDGNNITDRVDLGSVISSNKLSGYGLGKLTFVFKAHVGPFIDRTNNDNRIIDKSDGGGGDNGWFLEVVRPTTNTQHWQIGIDQANYTNSGFVVPGTAHETSAGIVLRDNTAGNNASFYSDGVFSDTQALGGNKTFPAGTTNATIGNWSHSSDRQWDGHIYHVYVYARELTAAEIFQLHVDPYQMFERPSPARFFSIAAAAGAALPKPNPLHRPFAGGPI